jgi:hypothetical protein
MGRTRHERNLEKRQAGQLRRSHAVFSLNRWWSCEFVSAVLPGFLGKLLLSLITEARACSSLSRCASVRQPVPTASPAARSSPRFLSWRWCIICRLAARPEGASKSQEARLKKVMAGTENPLPIRPGERAGVVTPAALFFIAGNDDDHLGPKRWLSARLLSARASFHGGSFAAFVPFARFTRLGGPGS